jgi:predicted  nucleic acid-binding Zn-ribbon protein
MKVIETQSYKTAAARPGEVKALEYQLETLKDKKRFLPKQIQMLRDELSYLPQQISALEKQIDALRSSK